MALVAAAGAIAACLLVAVFALARSGDSQEVSTPPSTATPPTFSFMVWNQEAGAWQEENLRLPAGQGENATFILNFDGSDRAMHELVVSFECSDSGSVELVVPKKPLAALTTPGPGRVRPDATALNGALAAWNTTFTEAPAWEAGVPCSKLQTLRFVAAGRGGSSSFIWETTSDARLSTGDSSLSVAASVDGEPPQTLSVSY